VALAHKLLFVTRERWEQVTTGDLRRGRQTWVYGRGGRPCLRCGTPIRRTEGRPPGAAGEPRVPGGPAETELEAERVTYWCPRCQPRPAAD
jgi:endonuclease-8